MLFTNMICISETNLDSFYFNRWHYSFLQGYNLVWSNHPSNIRRGGLCLYYKENLFLRIINVSFLSQCVLCEVTIQKKNGYVIVIYRSPSQTIVELDEFLSNFVKSFKILLSNFNHPFLLYSVISMQDLNHGG